MSRVSFVVPCFNGGALLGEAVDSALHSTYEDVEVVIVDDGSSDPSTLEVLQAQAERPRVTVVTQANAGLSAARNSGIRHASGDYVIPLDHDDAVLPAYAGRAAAVLDARPEVGIVYPRAERFGDSTGEWMLPPFEMGTMLLANCIPAASMFRKADWETVGGYDEAMRSGWEDWEFWLRILSLEREVVRLDEILFRYRDTPASMSDAMAQQTRVQIYATILERHSELYRRHAGAFAAAVVPRLELLSHYKRRYRLAEKLVGRVGGVGRRVLRRPTR